MTTAVAGIADRLAMVRSSLRTRWLGFTLGAIVGLALASVHWIGFIIGGALSASPWKWARSLRSASPSLWLVACLDRSSGGWSNWHETCLVNMVSQA